MNNRRQHFLPRYLMKRFCCETKGKQFYVWVYKNNKIYKTNIINVGLTSFHYGQGDITIDANLTNLDNSFSILLDNIIRHKNISLEEQPDIVDFIVHLLHRLNHSNALLLHVGNLMNYYIKSIVTNENMLKTVMTNHFNKNPNLWNSILYKEFEKINIPPQFVNYMIKNNMLNFEIFLDKNIKILLELGESICSELNNNMQSIVRKSHLRSLKESIIPKPRADYINSFNFKWILYECDRSNFILGDIGPTSIVDGEFCTLLFSKKDPDYIFLPISSNMIIVGYRNDNYKIYLKEINYETSKICLDFYISNNNTLSNEYHSIFGANTFDRISEHTLDALSKAFFDEYVLKP